MHDILLTGLILFSGFVPVTIALWYSRKLLIEAQKLQLMAQAYRDETKTWLLGEQFGTHLKNIINGMTGKATQEAKKHMTEQAGKLGIPPIGVKAIASGAASFAEDYGVSPKTAKGIKEILNWALNRPSKEVKAQQDALLQQYVQSDPNFQQVQPQFPFMQEQV